MAEEAVVASPATEKIPGKIVSAGIPQKLEVFIPSATPADNNDSNNNGVGGENNQQQNAAAAPADTTPTNTNTNTTPAADPTDEQLKAYFEKNGIAFEGLDKLKEKLTAPASPANTAPTPEEIEKARIEKERRLEDEHISRKGTSDHFKSLKNIIAADKKALGMQKEIEDLVAAGIPQEEATQLANERYFQLTDEQIEAIEDKDLKEKATKQREIGLKKLENKGTYLQTTAQSYLNILEKSIADRDAKKSKLEQHASTVEAAIKTYQRKETLDLGQIDDQKIDPIDFEYSDAALASAKEILIDGAKFDENLFTNDGGVKLEFILPHLVKSFSMNEAVKKGFLTGQTRAIEKMKSTFSATPPILGGNGKQNNGTPGKLASVGKPEVFRPTTQK